MAKNIKIDRLSGLPDNILSCNIFTRLSIKDVVRTSVLSTRWRFLWKEIPHLDFSKEFFQSYVEANDIIDNILRLHCGRIERFSIHAMFSNDFGQWIHHAALKDVKHLSLMTSSVTYTPPFVFACHLLMDLKLHNFRFTGIPTKFDGFRSLQSCNLSRLNDFTDDGLKQLIGLCPLLHKLVLTNCSGLLNLKIKSPNLKSLIIGSCHRMESLTADCPQLVVLAIQNCKSLIEFKMNSCVLFHGLHTSDVQIPKELQMLNSLRKLLVKKCPRVSASTLVTTLGCFRNLDEAHIQICEEDHWEQETVKGKVVADSTFPHLKKTYVDISSAMKKEEAVMLAFLLKNAPSLNTIIVTLPHCYENIHDKEFRNKVLDLQQIYEKVDIIMKIDKKRLDATCKYEEYMSYHQRDYVNDNCGSDYSL